MKKNPTLFLLAFIAFALNLNAQDGRSDVRFVQESRPNCSADPVIFTIEVKASEPGAEFFMSEQNYRFSFNDDILDNPTIVEELTVSNYISPLEVPRTANDFAFFSTHNLTGSLDTVVSYNVELGGGDGYYLTANEWVQVGRVQFDVMSMDSTCYDLEWHSQSVFPSTFVGEVYTDNGIDARSTTDENFYGNASGCLCILPVELISFTGEERDCKNHLEWETATETNSDYFIVERSLDAVQFTEIGRVTAAGNSQQNIMYNFVDSWAGATMYYRLKQVDIDGSYEYFNIIKIDSDCHADDVGTFIDVFPNPVVGEREAFVKLFSSNDETISIDVINVTGALVAETKANIAKGPNLLRFPTDNLAAGTYFIRVRGGSWYSMPSKLIKLNE